ncbi:MAG: TIGR03560 family F420-dependent LLM class oxidoreductase [Acidimicrobiales bacterium]
MEACIFTEPQQGAGYAALLAVAQAAERLGFTGFFRSDHYLKMGSVSGLPGPTDAWVTLGGIARETTSIRLGTLVSPATFRLPGPLAIAVAQVDDMSGGRVEFGFGAGWYEAEHRAYGIPFPGVAERFELLTEQLEVITGLWGAPLGERFSYEGRHYRLEESPALPKPAQRPGPPVIIGGGGRRKTAALTARFAAEFNRAFVPLRSFARTCDNVRQACEQVGRDPATLKLSAALVACCGRTDAELARRAAAIGRELDELRENGAAGTVEEVAAKVAGYRDAGAQRIYFQVLDLADLEHLELLAEAAALL